MCVNDGAVWWKCEKCRSDGILAPGAAMIEDVRKAHGPEYITGPPWKECGIEFETCPQCDKDFYEKAKEIKQTN